MGKRRSMMRKKKYDDAHNRHMIKPWSDLTHDVLLLAMMKLGVFDFNAFSRVCKSWRSLAVSNMNKFIVSKRPMSICISTHANEKEEHCYLEDFEGRKLKIILPHLVGRTCVGVTCGYLILFGEKTCDFWLVNPITRHEIHLPNIRGDIYCCPENNRAILVFLPSISRCVFVVFSRCFNNNIWFCIVGEPEWTEVPTPFPIHDLIAFKGKMYTAHYVKDSGEVKLCEMKLYLEHKLVLLETMSFPKPDFGRPGFVTSGENLYLIDMTVLEHPHKIHKLDLDETKWVPREIPGKAYDFFLYDCNVCDDDLQYGRYVIRKNGKGRSAKARLWYFFFDCLNADLIHE